MLKTLQYSTILQRIFILKSKVVLCGFEATAISVFVYPVVFRTKSGTAEMYGEIDRQELLLLVKPKPGLFLAINMPGVRYTLPRLLRLAFTRFGPRATRFWFKFGHGMFLFGELLTHLDSYTDHDGHKEDTCFLSARDYCDDGQSRVPTWTDTKKTPTRYTVPRLLRLTDTRFFGRPLLIF